MPQFDLPPPIGMQPASDDDADEDNEAQNLVAAPEHVDGAPCVGAPAADAEQQEQIPLAGPLEVPKSNATLSFVQGSAELLSHARSAKREKHVTRLLETAKHAAAQKDETLKLTAHMFPAVGKMLGKDAATGRKIGRRKVSGLEAKDFASLALAVHTDRKASSKTGLGVERARVDRAASLAI